MNSGFLAVDFGLQILDSGFHVSESLIYAQSDQQGDCGFLDLNLEFQNSKTKDFRFL